MIWLDAHWSGAEARDGKVTLALCFLWRSSKKNITTTLYICLFKLSLKTTTSNRLMTYGYLVFSYKPSSSYYTVWEPGNTPIGRHFLTFKDIWCGHCRHTGKAVATNRYTYRYTVQCRLAKPGSKGTSHSNQKREDWSEAKFTDLLQRSPSCTVEIPATPASVFTITWDSIPEFGIEAHNSHVADIVLIQWTLFAIVSGTQW